MFSPRVVVFAAAARSEPSSSPAGGRVPPVHARRISVLRQQFRRAGLGIPSRTALAVAMRRACTTELDRGIAFILAPAFLAVGAIVYYSLSREPGFIALAVPVFATAALCLATRSRPAAHLVLGAAALCLLGALLAKAETMRAGTRMLGAEIATIVTGQVAEIEHMASGRTRLTIDLISTSRPVLRQAPERIRVSAGRCRKGSLPGRSSTAWCA